MTELYYLVLQDGRHFENIPLDEAKRILIDDCHYSYAYVQQLLRRAHPDTTPVDIEYSRNEKRRDWVVNGRRVNEKAALFALEFAGITKKKDRELLLDAHKLIAKVAETTQKIKSISENIDREWKSWLLSRKSS